MDSVILQKLDEGKLFYYKNVLDFTSESPEVKEILIKTPAEPIIIYYKGRFSANIEVKLSILEGVTVTGEGSEIVICNNNRECGIVPDTKLFSGHAGVTGGVDIWPARIGARPDTPPIKNPISSPVVSEMETPIKCKAATYYNIKMEKINSDDGYIDIYMRWYEHEQRN